jgi:hypothetical protein
MSILAKNLTVNLYLEKEKIIYIFVIFNSYSESVGMMFSCCLFYQKNEFHLSKQQQKQRENLSEPGGSKCLLQIQDAYNKMHSRY